MQPQQPSRTDTTTDYVLGLDLGQAQEFTALAVLQRTRHQPIYSSLQAAYRTYAVVHLKRWPLQTRYADIVAEVVQMAHRKPIERPLLVVDQTGVGMKVVDLLRQARREARLRVITLTAGTAMAGSDDNSIHVPKKEVVGNLQLLLQAQRLKVGKMRESELLVQELASFKMSRSIALDDDVVSWREREHDDLVLAVALACWQGESEPDFIPPQVLPAAALPYSRGAPASPWEARARGAEKPSVFSQAWWAQRGR